MSSEPRSAAKQHDLTAECWCQPAVIQIPGKNGRTMQDDLDQLREAWLDFAYAVVKALGIVALAKHLGLKMKPWIRDREARRG